MHENLCPLVTAFTDVGVVCPGMICHDAPGGMRKFVPFAFPAVPFAAVDTGLMIKSSAVASPWSAAEAGFVMNPPFGFGPTAVTAVPPVVTVVASPGCGVTAI